MWKAILLASSLVLATASGQAATPMQAPSPAAAFAHGAPGVETVQYRHDRGNHYGWYKNKHRRHHGWYKHQRHHNRHW